MPHSEEQLHQALDRIVAGIGAKNRYERLSFAAARLMLDAAITELVAIRADYRDWLCLRCKTVYEKQGVCPVCKEEVFPYGQIERDALRRRVRELEERVDWLEEVARQAMNLDETFDS